ncbi:type VI secretion system-associated protein TagO [Shimia thalassica]|uniref:type VI secretion system-associated protein TagO n=1 Tax=Shimia thalassica TaxID=1715693 RepID=UPI0027337541|nr:type VI secretion system-associated protein TagO [Shimia thalassica]MDP2495878.1 type VI secretion system-associated protein TagO [Shimia thalassica]
MIRTLTIALCLAATASHASECLAIDNDLDRLACYDRESGRTPVTDVLENTPATGNWNIRTKTSDFKDTTDVYMTVESSEAVSCRSYGNANRITLMVRCLENTTSIFFYGDCHFADHNGYDKVEYRIDDNPAGSRRFDSSTDSKALGLWNGGSSIPFVKKLIGADELLLRATPFSESPITMKFNIVGLDEAIKPLRKECGW